MKTAFHTEFLLQVVPYEAFFQDVSCALSLSATLFPVVHSTGPETAFVSKLGHTQVCLQMCRITWRHMKTNAMFLNYFLTSSQPTGFVYFYFILSSIARQSTPQCCARWESPDRKQDTEINSRNCLFFPTLFECRFKKKPIHFWK